MIGWIEVAALVFGLVISALITLSPRFWTGSRSLLFLILPASFSAALEVFGCNPARLEADMHRLAFACIICHRRRISHRAAQEELHPYTRYRIAVDCAPVPRPNAMLGEEA